MSGDGRLIGTVAAFDAAVGLGEVEAGREQGAHFRQPHTGAGAGTGAVASSGRYRFHCTQIADGTRQVEIGTTVTFRLLAGRDGHWEAADLRPSCGAGSPATP